MPRKTGSRYGTYPKNVQRFWSNVVKGDGCWVWTGRKDRDGYGVVRVNGIRKAHRVSWFLENGSDPGPMCVMHSCDRPECVNPAHLSLGTHADNQRDKLLKGRAARGASHGKTKLSDADVDMLRLAFETLPVTQVELARAFGVSESLVWRIVRRGQRAA